MRKEKLQDSFGALQVVVGAVASQTPLSLTVKVSADALIAPSNSAAANPSIRPQLAKITWRFSIL
jgi:hypothetical protein